MSSSGAAQRTCKALSRACTKSTLKQLRIISRSISSSSNPYKSTTTHLVTLPNGTVLRRPEEPSPEECCGRGCTECVWTTHWNELKYYEAVVSDARGIPRPLDPFEELERRLAEKKKSGSGSGNTNLSDPQDR